MQKIYVSRELGGGRNNPKPNKWKIATLSLIGVLLILFFVPLGKADLSLGNQFIQLILQSGQTQDPFTISNATGATLAKIDVNGNALTKGLNATNITAKNIGGVIYADQYATLLDAFNACPNTGSCKIFLAKGTYNTPTITVNRSGVVFEGTSKNDVIIQNNTASIFNLTGTASNYIYDFELRSAHLKSFGTNSLLVAYRAARMIIDDSIFEGGNYGIIAYAPTQSHIKNSLLTGQSVGGIYFVSNGNTSTDTCSDSTITNTQVFSSLSDGIKLDTCDGVRLSTVSTLGNVYGISVNNTHGFGLVNSISDSNTQVNLLMQFSNSFEVSNNYFGAAGVVNIQINKGTTDGIFLGNTIKASQGHGVYGATSDAINNISDITFIGNNFIGNNMANTTDRHGAKFDGDLGGSITNISFFHNTFSNYINAYTTTAPGTAKGYQNYGIKSTGGATNFRVVWNVFGNLMNGGYSLSGTNTVENNYGSSPFNFGNLASSPSAFGSGDTYFNTAKNLPCYYNGTNWNYYNNNSAGC